MKNLADLIENFILRELFTEEETSLLVQRNELAERLSCAPSQISYVLSTRFTPERGYLVESRRGSGGFIRIVRCLPEERTTVPTTAELVEQLAAEKLLTAREKTLLQYFLQIIDVNEQDKQKLVQQALRLLAIAEDRGR